MCSGARCWGRRGLRAGRRLRRAGPAGRGRRRGVGSYGSVCCRACTTSAWWSRSTLPGLGRGARRVRLDRVVRQRRALLAAVLPRRRRSTSRSRGSTSCPTPRTRPTRTTTSASPSWPSRSASRSAALWEIVEWASDNTLGSNLQLDNDDTIGDLIADSLGSLCGAGLLVCWARWGWGSVRRIPGENRLRGHRGRLTAPPREDLGPPLQSLLRRARRDADDVEDVAPLRGRAP